MNNKPRFPLSEEAGLVVGGSAGILHGNSARVNSRKPFRSLWASVVNDHRDRPNGRNDCFDDERCAVIAKHEVDSNPL